MATYSVTSGYTLSGTTVTSGGVFVSTLALAPNDILIVSSGGAAQALTLNGDTISVLRGGTTSGIIVSSGGKEVFTGRTTVAGTSVYAGGVVSNGVAAGTVDPGLYVASGGLLDITGPISNQVLPVTVDSGGQIEFGGVGAAGVVTGSGTTNVTASAGIAAHNSIEFTSAYTFTSGSIPNGASSRILLTVTCFAAGTRILTDAGERPVEAIQPGDTVAVLRNGEQVLEPVIWVGFSRIDLAKHPKPELAAPIRIRAGALAEQTPTRDLLLSPEHCLIIDGSCVPVKLLVNGASIAREHPAEPFTYYHVELADHGIIFAEGAASESYLDTGNRVMFDNADSPRLLHPMFELNATAERWKTDACAPLATTPDQVAPLWQSLAERSVALGFPVPMPTMIANPDLHIMVDGKRLQPTSDRNTRYVFMVPAGVSSVTLNSRFCIPADKMIPGQRDTRRLGVRVDWLSIRSSTVETILPADHPDLRQGWNDVERDSAAMWRWTDGAATIPWSSIQGVAVLTVCCTPVDHYPLYDEKLRLVA